MFVGSDSASRRRRSVHRLRLAAICVGLTLLVFSQSSGLPAADTKLDLVVDPLRFLANGVRMWDPLGNAGQLQNQAYGYLFPMGPAFLLGHWSQLPVWVVQRAWESGLIVAAFLGAVRLARLLQVRGTWPRVGVGLAYALAPRMIMEIGVISSELLPVVALPWLLIPLVEGSTRGSPRRAAARSGVALLFAGGINAAATLAVLPVPALWLLTRAKGPRRRSLLSWWVVAVVLACAWWIVPLLVLGRYSPPFLDWIESSAVTTGRTDLVEVLRGTDHWQAYLGPSVWPAGWIFVASGATVIATVLVAAAGVFGLSRRPPQRLFLLSSLALGIVVITAGHVSTVGPLFAPELRHALDGPLNAFRNIHKFDPLARLPLAVGVGHALAWCADRVRARRSLALPGGALLPTRALALGLTFAVGLVAIAPALSGRVVPDTRTSNDPSWWRSAGSWLGHHERDGGGRALVVPGAPAPVYLWGEPRDDALQPVAGGPWTVRDVAPLARAGYVRWLDAVEATLASGTADPTLPAMLARAGVRYLVVRNDLDAARSGATPQRFVHAALDGSPDLRRVASFGPDVDGPPDPSRLVDQGLSGGRPAVEIYQNAAWSGEVSLMAAGDTVRANGSTDALPALLHAGLTTETPVVLGSGPGNVLTDGIRRREFGFGSVDRYSQTLTRGAPFQAQRAAHDYLPDDAGPLTTASYLGIDAVTASSSASDPTAIFYRGPQYSPWAALDGSSATSWISATDLQPTGQWLDVNVGRLIRPAELQIAFTPGLGGYPTRVRVSTDSAAVAQDVVATSRPQALRVPAGATRQLRVTVLAAEGSARQVGIRSLTIRGVSPARVLDVTGPRTPEVITFRAAFGERDECVTFRGAPVCDPSWVSAGEDDVVLTRGFSLGAARSYLAEQSVMFRAGRQLDALLDRGNIMAATATSRESADPRQRPGAVVDGSTDSGWVSAAGDTRPAITVTTARPVTLRSIRLRPFTHAPVATAREVSIRAADVSFRSRIRADGVIELPRAVRTSAVTVTVERASVRSTTDSQTGQRRLLPVGIGEIQLAGTQPIVPTPPSEISIGCGGGLVLVIDGRPVQMQVRAPTATVLAGREVVARPCGAATVSLAAGRHVIAGGSNALLATRGVVLREPGSDIGTGRSAGRAEIATWTATRRAVRVRADEAALLVVRENANAGWQAELGGRPLRAVTVDGWQQGWLVPAGASGTVELTFGPQRAATVGLLGGAAAVVLLLALAFLRRGPGRSSEYARIRENRPRWLAAAALTAAMVLAGGLVGAVVAGLAGVVIVANHRFRWKHVSVRTLSWAAVGLVLVAGVASALRTAASTGYWAGTPLVQTLVLAGVALTVATLFARPAAPREASQQRAFQEIPGGSGGDDRAAGGK